jgi:hypothetical protein
MGSNTRKTNKQTNISYYIHQHKYKRMWKRGKIVQERRKRTLINIFKIG